MYAQSLTPLTARLSKQLKLSPVPVNKVEDTVVDGSPCEPQDFSENDAETLSLGTPSTSEDVGRNAEVEEVQQEAGSSQSAEADTWFEMMEDEYGALSNSELSALIRGILSLAFALHRVLLGSKIDRF
jgi:hypothetical protein